ncbi:glycine zipper 2TM domain-containing protein [Hymenobacter busanensis]|uniref:Glycine zipper 2TM domain-containing protein n=1 Tax=Hymenobacter busanensis TaxID=2607656 RepID=A0A7L4ZW96_9BACT|nr:YMGG-like glycine zipper-containing protein [Hymenobacter busanensis]KAA9332160.1 glycine zipper 2TM domain-containing protein [Hymenobacter busanensis]QHJ07501.1 glycine zipper 2TM domain-containing protein [Hymenobacter busanensis]
MKKLPYIFSLLLAVVMLMQSVSVQAQSKVSPQAKGAIIGGLGGAAAGAIINKKNRVVGGAVGAAAGAGTGYMIGRNIQNKRKAQAAEAARVAAANRAARAEREAAAARAERNALAKRAEAAERKAAIAQVQQQQPQYPAMASGFAAASAPAMMYTNAGAPMAMNAAYLPNESYGDRSTPYPSSEVRRKSW